MTSRKGFSKKALSERVEQDAEFAELYRKAIGDTIGEALREARRAANLSQRVVAERMGVSEPRVAQIEGEAGASLSLRSLKRYAAAVGCRLDIALVDVSSNKAVSTVIVGDDRIEESPHSPSRMPERFVVVYQSRRREDEAFVRGRPSRGPEELIQFAFSAPDAKRPSSVSSSRWEGHVTAGY